MSIKFIWQCGLTHDGGAPAFVACDDMNCPPHIFGVVGLSPVSLDVFALSLSYQLSITLWWCCMLRCHLIERKLFWL